MDDSLRRHARGAGEAIRAGRLRGEALWRELVSVPFVERDAWIDEALELQAPPDDVPGLPPGTVPYVPCAVDAILHTVLDAPVHAHDVFVDLGAGLGRVALLVHLLTGARAVGVEMQPPLVECARATARRLDAHAVTFHLGDAATTEVADGTVFFIYASFSPAVLRRVLRWLEGVASQRAIVLCAVGFDVHGESWLEARPSRSPELALYAGRPASGLAR